MEFPRELESTYLPVRELSRGGFGTVWLANQESLGRNVAVKVLHSLEDPVSRQRFRKEAVLTALLRHPNIVAVIDHGEASGTPWIAYEFVEGRSLRGLVDAGRLPVPAVLEIGIQVAAALEHAHEKGVLHRDIKPDNILEAFPGHYKVCDFGIGRYEDGGEALTAEGFLLGTPAYMSPQQVKGEIPAPSSDVYSLGSTLFELLTGETPFSDPSPVELLGQKLRRSPPGLLERRPDAPEALARLIARALSPSRADRHESAREMRLELEALLEGGASRPAPAGATVSSLRTAPVPVAGESPAAGRRPWRGTPGLLAAVSLALATMWALTPSRPIPPVVTPVTASPAYSSGIASPGWTVEDFRADRTPLLEAMNSSDAGMEYQTPFGLNDQRLEGWSNLVNRSAHVFKMQKLLKELTIFFRKYPGSENVRADWLEFCGPATTLGNALGPLWGAFDERDDLRQTFKDLEDELHRSRGPVERDAAAGCLTLVALGPPLQSGEIRPARIAELYLLADRLARSVPRTGEESTVRVNESRILSFVLDMMVQLQMQEKVGLGGSSLSQDLTLLHRETLPRTLARLSELVDWAASLPSTEGDRKRMALDAISTLTTESNGLVFDGVTGVTGRDVLRRAVALLERSSPGPEDDSSAYLLQRARATLAR